MAKKKSTASTKQRRKRRSPEEMIADLQKQIESVKQRAVARSLKSSPAIRQALSAVRAIDKGLDAAADEDNGALRHALADARKPLAEFLGEQGVKLPKARLPRGRRPAKKGE